MSNPRPFGDLTQDLEDLLEEVIQEHDLQMGEILSWIHQYLATHYPDCVEVYQDGTSPLYFYGAPEMHAKLYSAKKGV